MTRSPASGWWHSATRSAATWSRYGWSAPSTAGSVAAGARTDPTSVCTTTAVVVHSPRRKHQRHTGPCGRWHARTGRARARQPPRRIDVADRALRGHRQRTCDVTDLGHIETGNDPSDERARRAAATVAGRLRPPTRPSRASRRSAGSTIPSSTARRADGHRHDLAMEGHVGVGDLLAVIGHDPHVVRATLGPVRRSPEPRDRPDRSTCSAWSARRESGPRRCAFSS